MQLVPNKAGQLAGRNLFISLFLLIGTLTVLSACSRSSGLIRPNEKKLAAASPDLFKVTFETTKGTFLLEVQRDWAPHGADRFYYLVRNKFFDGARFFRVIEGFMVQFGLNGDPAVSEAWNGLTIPDDEVRQSNQRGLISFAATSARNSRTTQVFINFGDNARLDGMGFTPFGQVIEGMEVVDSLYSGYGEGAPRGMGPDQGRIKEEGTLYLEQEFPELDYIISARVTK